MSLATRTTTALIRGPTPAGASLARRARPARSRRLPAGSPAVASSSRSSSDVDDHRAGRAAGAVALAPAVAAAVAAAHLAFAPLPASALYNKDLDIPITDPTQAVSVVYAVRDSIADVVGQIKDFETSCPAPTFPCDLSQPSVKISSRVSGPLKRSLPTLSEAYGADPYAVQDILQSVSTSEAMLYANMARVKVDFKGPVTFLDLVDSTIAAFLEELPEDARNAGRERWEACDLTVDPTEPGDLECRMGRAVASGARPTGGMG